MEDLFADSFEAHIGTIFHLRGQDGPGRDFTLLEVQIRPDTDGKCFSLLFSDPGADVVPQGTYFFDHDALGELALFVVPIGPGADGVFLYESVFNKI